MAKEVTKPCQIVEIGDILQIIVQGTIIEATNLEETPEGMVDKIIEIITGMMGMVVTIEIGIGQGIELLQGIMVMAEIEALAMIDLDQDPELVQTGIGYDAMYAENMIILQEIALTLEKREI